jgi:hypothetical protein
MATQRKTLSKNHWQRRSDQAQVVFTPQAPIHRREFFVGRVQQISKLLDTIRQPGAHAIVYGERGVGKTSLVTILPPLLEFLKYAGIVTSKIQCNDSDTYESICRKLMSNLTVTANNTVLANYEKKLPLPDTLDLWLSENPTPDELRRLVLTLGGRHLIAIIDEFDRIANKNDITNMVANTIKLLSDTLSPSTFIIVGIGDTVEGLIAGHGSIDRCLTEIPMPRMNIDEMRELINAAVKEIKMTIDDEATQYICRIAQGLPSYVHLLGRESALAAIDDEALHITKSHAVRGLHSALGLVPGILIQDWDKATASPKPNNLFKQVLLACALAPKSELGFFPARSVQAPFSAITGKTYEIPGYGGSLHLLTEERRAAILQKRGESHRWRYRFRNPLMEPYAIMYGVKHNLLTEELVTRFMQVPIHPD